ncbi:hypothetical protein [uncultured Sulfitobacter sp.]|uniref:hypothetical protein n=1 Tax=uncultured Sulfitobacter sp. TaxID=191468 RepID=UPI0026288354|nr:hypothetical protein [uncultured Sulfitobacter sp.]
MELESVTLKLPRELLSGAQRVATARDVSIGHMVRQLLKREVDRQLGTSREGGPDKRLLTALKALLARDMEEASDWSDLADRLRLHGYELREVRGGIILRKSSCGTHVCKAAEIGFSEAILAKRFGAPMPRPAHINTHLGVMPAGDIDATRHAMLSENFAQAKGWPDLINRLACVGMELRPVGADLGVYVAATSRHLCNAGSIGAPLGTLVHRFGGPLPGHS